MAVMRFLYQKWWGRRAGYIVSSREIIVVKCFHL